MILTGSTSPEELKLSHSLALKAAALNPDLIQAKAFAAVAYDRFLWSSNKPQIYGTQVTQSKDGKWIMDPFDRTAITDEQRSEYGIASVKTLEERLKTLNEEGFE